MEPAAITDEVKKSNLRGLGGAGFPTGTKWGFIPKKHTGPVYLVVNADEGEPGTFKDRYLLERDPHALIEGMLIAARAIGCHTSASSTSAASTCSPWRVFSEAVREAYDAGLLGTNILGSGFDRSSCTAAPAPTSAARRRGCSPRSRARRAGPRSSRRSPRSRAPSASRRSSTTSRRSPRAAHHQRAAREWFAGLGTKTQGGTRLYSVSGHVERPGVVRGVGVRSRCAQLIDDHAGGVPDGRRLKAVVPGGSSAPILTADEIDVTMDVDGLKNAGTMIGSAGVIVMDETRVDPRGAAWCVARFYAHESCGQCTPCRESHRLDLQDDPTGSSTGKGRKDDLDTILDVAKRGAGTTICAFYDGAVGPYI